MGEGEVEAAGGSGMPGEGEGGLEFDGEAEFEAAAAALVVVAEDERGAKGEALTEGDGPSGAESGIGGAVFGDSEPDEGRETVPAEGGFVIQPKKGDERGIADLRGAGVEGDRSAGRGGQGTGHGGIVGQGERGVEESGREQDGDSGCHRFRGLSRMEEKETWQVLQAGGAGTNGFRGRCRPKRWKMIRRRVGMSMPG